MEKTLKVFNDLEKKCLIKRYVIGGGIAVLFYAEPILTYDLDVFCLLPAERGGLITLSDLYKYLPRTVIENKRNILLSKEYQSSSFPRIMNLWKKP